MKKLLLVLFFFGFFGLWRGVPAWALELSSLVPANNSICFYVRLDQCWKNFTEQDGGLASDLFEAGFIKGWSQGQALKGSRPRSAEGITGKSTFSTLAGVFKNLQKKFSVQPQALVVYFASPEEFVVLVPGKYSAQSIRSCFAREFQADRAGGVTITLNAANTADWSLSLYVSDSLMFLSPSGFEGNVQDALAHQTPLASSSWNTFFAMIKSQPLLAVEANLESLFKTFADARIPVPQPYEPVKLVRWFVGPDLIKSQFYVPDEQAKTLFPQTAKGFAEALRQSLEKNLFPLASSTTELLPLIQQAARDMKWYASGKSFFVQSPGLKGAHALLGALMSGLAAGFLADHLQLPPSSSQEITFDPKTGQDWQQVAQTPDAKVPMTADSDF